MWKKQVCECFQQIEKSRVVFLVLGQKLGEIDERDKELLYQNVSYANKFSWMVETLFVRFLDLFSHCSLLFILNVFIAKSRADWRAFAQNLLYQLTGYI